MNETSVMLDPLSGTCLDTICVVLVVVGLTLPAAPHVHYLTHL